ncbi:MAG: VWA domain-containing protein [Desulforhopalus sp.]
MYIRTRNYYSTILLSTILLHGCSGSPLPETKGQNQPAISAPAPAGSTQTAEEVVSALPPITPAEPNHLRQSMGIEQRATMSRKESKATEGTPVYAKVYGNMVEDRQISPLSPRFNRESYDALTETAFIATANDPLSTFSIDVDTASYANVRRWLTGGNLPPVGAVRIEELINYFSYQYPEPEDGPIGITAELGPCPWQPENKLVRIGVKAEDLDPENIPASNLVFLIDVSGSMNQPNKLPLLQQSMLLLTDQLTGEDTVSIVAYAGSDMVILPPTAGHNKKKIRAAITTLSPGGATHASSGIVTAYSLARQSFKKNGNNRIILASDGDFNVGVTSRGELERLVVRERESGIFLTVLGFGMGNYHDDTMEILADKGNGNYSYIDTLLEAKKVLIKERVANLFTLARDVKLQIEFNPAHVGGYRLIGYENRALVDEDFNNDTKDAGEIGAGHTVTALYELLPAGSKSVPKVDPLKYQHTVQLNNTSEEILSVKLRYKPLDSDESSILTKAVTDYSDRLEATSDDFRFAATVAGFGMLLRHSDHVSQLTYPELIVMARNSRGTDNEGYRAEFIQLLEMAELTHDKR